MAMALLPLVIPMIPELVKDVRDLVAAFQNPDLTPEQRKAQLDDLAARLDARVAEVEAYQFRTPGEGPGAAA